MNFACGEEYQKHIGEQLDEDLWVKDSSLPPLFSESACRTPPLTSMRTCTMKPHRVKQCTFSSQPDGGGGLHFSMA